MVVVVVEPMLATPGPEPPPHAAKGSATVPITKSATSARRSRGWCAARAAIGALVVLPTQALYIEGSFTSVTAFRDRRGGWGPRRRAPGITDYAASELRHEEGAWIAKQNRFSGAATSGCAAEFCGVRCSCFRHLPAPWGKWRRPPQRIREKLLQREAINSVHSAFSPTSPMYSQASTCALCRLITIGDLCFLESSRPQLSAVSSPLNSCRSSSTSTASSSLRTKKL